MVFAELPKFLPAGFPEHVPVLVVDGAVVEPGAKKNDKTLDLVGWLAAWDNYALVAAALGQMPHIKCMRHKAHILDVR